MCESAEDWARFPERAVSPKNLGHQNRRYSSAWNEWRAIIPVSPPAMAPFRTNTACGIRPTSFGLQHPAVADEVRVIFAPSPELRGELPTVHQQRRARGKTPVRWRETPLRRPLHAPPLHSRAARDENSP